VISGPVPSVGQPGIIVHPRHLTSNTITVIIIMLQQSGGVCIQQLTFSRLTCLLLSSPLVPCLLLSPPYVPRVKIIDLVFVSHSLEFPWSLESSLTNQHKNPRSATATINPKPRSSRQKNDDVFFAGSRQMPRKQKNIVSNQVEYFLLMLHPPTH
jgi:hypothetical protein